MANFSWKIKEEKIENGYSNWHSSGSFGSDGCLYKILQARKIRTVKLEEFMNDYNSIIYDMPTQSELSNMLGFGISVIIFYIIFIIAFCVLFGGGIAGQSHMFAKREKHLGRR